MIPTNEQKQIVDLAVNTSGDLKITAYAGTGKTTTLRMIAEALPYDEFLYLAFNKALQLEAKSSFPNNVTAVTTHGLAYRSMKIFDTPWKNRLKKAKVDDFGAALSIKKGIGSMGLGESISAIRECVNQFCTTTQKTISRANVPFWAYAKDEGQKETIMEEVVHYADILWELMSDPWEKVPITHDFYLKTWQLEEPKISQYHAILFDEAQDANPVILDIISKQDHLRRFYVGDEYQQIYSWRGAVNAMSKIPCEGTGKLTQSFRFGEAIAEKAREVLKIKGADIDIKGLKNKSGELSELDTDKPFTIVSRTNAQLIESALSWAKEKKMAVVGGIEDPLRKIFSAYYLYCDKPERVTDPEIKCFKNWEQMIDASKITDQFEIKRICDFIKKYKGKVPGLIKTLREVATYGEEEADIILSTGHKAKGREWNQVFLTEDFADSLDDKEGVGIDGEEINLLYVAVTRAQERLEIDEKVISLLEKFGTTQSDISQESHRLPKEPELTL